MWFVVLLGRLILGSAAVSAVYTLLAGGGLKAFIVTAFFVPPVWMIFNFIRTYERVDWMLEVLSGNRKPFRFVYCWIFLGYLSLPIVFNLASLAAQSMGFDAAGQILHANRYMSMVLVKVTLTIILLLAAAFHPACRLAFWLIGRIPSSPTPAS